MRFRNKKIVSRPEVRDIGAACPSGLSPIRSELMRRIFWYRGIQDMEELDCSLDRMLSPQGFRNGEAATDLLSRSIVEGQRIVIVGDYDADGATATTLGVRALRAFGAADVRYIVPDRFKHGYGLSPDIAAEALTERPDLVITVDNGISSHEGVTCLKEQGVRVLITDHHLPGDRLPEADAILNPNQRGCEFGSKNLAGVGVMFYLLIMVRSRLASTGWFEEHGMPSPNLAVYLDLVALGTVADLVPLDRNNRILVSQGISRIREGACCKGILALLEVSRKKHERIVSADLGFAVAPRLNASGRLEKISTGIECLLADDDAEALEYARRLEDINRERKDIEKAMREEAAAIVGDLSLSDFTESEGGDRLQHRICLYDPKWHQGVNGLVASRMKELTGLPVVVFARTEEGSLTGSARSVKGLHIRDLLDTISCQNPGLIMRFGGHAMAAGLTIEPAGLEKFRTVYREQVETFLRERGDIDMIETDGMLHPDEMSLDNADSIREAGIWGQAFPVPTFFGNFHVRDARVVGDIHLKMRLAVKGGEKDFDAIAFNALSSGEQAPRLNRIQAVYQLDVNEFRDRRRVQLLIDYFTPL